MKSFSLKCLGSCYGYTEFKKRVSLLYFTGLTLFSRDIHAYLFPDEYANNVKQNQKENKSRSLKAIYFSATISKTVPLTG